MFSPYHTFQHGARFEHVVAEIRDAGNMSDEAYAGYCRYHPALMHKLRSAKFNLDRLEEKLTTTDIQEAADTTGEFMFEVNMFIDGFFYNCGSALDILAREVLVLFGEPLPDRVYFRTARQTLEANRPDDPILPRFQDPSWLADFAKYRNTLTHELVIAPSYQIHINSLGDSQSYRIVFPLPDNPRAIPEARTYRRHPNALEYIGKTFTRLLRLINSLYGDVHQRVRQSGTIPL